MCALFWGTRIEGVGFDAHCVDQLHSCCRPPAAVLASTPGSLPQQTDSSSGNCMHRVPTPGHEYHTDPAALWWPRR